MQYKHLSLMKNHSMKSLMTMHTKMRRKKKDKEMKKKNGIIKKELHGRHIQKNGNDI